MALFSFTGQSQQDPSAQAGLQQYIQQGQSQIDPGRAQIAASDPVSAAARSGFADALKYISPNIPQLPMGAVQAGLVGGAAMGQPGPTPQALALAKGLMPQPMTNNVQQFLNPGY